MNRITSWSMGLLLMLAGVSSAQTHLYYSDVNDGMLELRSDWTNGPAIHNTNEWFCNLGEWYCSGLTEAVIPFQLPDYGPISNLFSSADFKVNFYEKGDFTVTPIDLYGVRVDASPLISTNDWYSGASADPSATMIQAGFLSPSTSYGAVNTDTAGDTNLVDYLNAAYDAGEGAGQFVFLRLSWASNSYASAWDAYSITTRNAENSSDWPVISVTLRDVDQDLDGLPTVWEIDNNLDPYDDGTTDIVNGAIGDPDGDSLVNSNEYLLGTDPQDDDSDDDGLSDGEEADVTFTDPLDYDSDDDTLSDGDEVNTHGSNPNTPHSDADGEDDATEVFQGTNPSDPLSSSAASGWIIMDGTRDALYGDAVATQTVNTVWGDNGDELDAAYVHVQNGRLFLMLTGNLSDNWNKSEIFIDSTEAVTTNVLDAEGTDGTDFMDGLTFDAGFSPDYHLYARRGAGNLFSLDMVELGTANVSEYGNVLNWSMEGYANTGTGAANASPIGIAYDNSNTNGLVFGTNAVDVAAVLAVTNGLELSIALSDIGNPGVVRISVFINGENHDWISNQILGGLVPEQGALGRDGLGGDGGGTLTNDLSSINFNNFPGEQFFTVKISPPAPDQLESQLVSANTEMQLHVGGLYSRAGYKVQVSTNLVTDPFVDLAESEFTADSTNMVITVPVDTEMDPVLFYKIIANQ